MTAGKGISHSERFENAGLLEGNSLDLLQIWVALPEKIEEAEPRFANYQPSQPSEHTDKKKNFFF